MCNTIVLTLEGWRSVLEASVHMYIHFGCVSAMSTYRVNQLFDIKCWCVRNIQWALSTSIIPIIISFILFRVCTTHTLGRILMLRFSFHTCVSTTYTGWFSTFHITFVKVYLLINVMSPLTFILYVYNFFSFTAQNGFSSLYVASDAGHTDIVDTLLKHGADPNLAIMVWAQVWLGQYIMYDLKFGLCLCAAYWWLKFSWKLSYMWFAFPPHTNSFPPFLYLIGFSPLYSSGNCCWWGSHGNSWETTGGWCQYQLPEQSE